MAVMEADRLIDKVEALETALLFRDAPIHGRDLAHRIGVPERDIRTLVYVARCQNIPVVSGNEGYALAHTPEEAERAAKRLRSHAIRELLAGRCLRRWARQERLRLEHPGVLFDMGVGRWACAVGIAPPGRPTRRSPSFSG